MAYTYDLAIRNALIVDGSGEGDVGVHDGRISRVERRVAGKAGEAVDARGLVLTPGFVDVHTHYDGQATWSSRFADVDPLLLYGMHCRDFEVASGSLKALRKYRTGRAGCP